MMLIGCGSFLKNRFFVLRTRFPYLFIREFGDRHLPEQFVWRVEMTCTSRRGGHKITWNFREWTILYSLICYGPSARLIFDGDERKFELWEIKFLGYLRLKKLDAILTPLAEDANKEARAADATKNADAYAELIQCLDDRSLTLVIREAANDGRKALSILP